MVVQRDNQGKISNRVSAILIMVIGIGVLIAGIGMAAVRKHKDNCYGFVTGKVVGVAQYGNSGDDDTTYSAVYLYQVGGTEYELTDDKSSYDPPKRGITVEIRYEPDNPDQAYVGGRLLPGSLLISVGIMLIMLSIFIFVKTGKAQRTAERKMVIELLTGFIYMLVCIVTIIIYRVSDENLGSFGIIVAACGIFGIIVVFTSVKNYIAVKMGRTPSESIVSRLSLDDRLVKLNDESEGEAYDIPKYLLQDTERMEETEIKS